MNLCCKLINLFIYFIKMNSKCKKFLPRIFDLNKNVNCQLRSSLIKSMRKGIFMVSSVQGGHLETFIFQK